MQFIATTLKDTELIAHETKTLIQKLTHTNIYLNGDLGLGKTTFVQFFLQLFHIKTATSPSYSIINTYPYKDSFIHHGDMYRIENVQSTIEELSLDEYLESKKDICLIEWSNKFQSFFNQFPNISITINNHQGDKRIFSIFASHGYLELNKHYHSSSINHLLYN